MVIRKQHYWFGLFIFLTQVVYFCDCLSFETLKPHLRFSHKLEDELLRLFTGVSLTKCARECDARAPCLSINYYRQWHVCELNTKASSDGQGLVKKDGSLYVEILKWTAETSRQCGDDICSSEKTCDETTLTCVIKECPLPTPKPVGNMNAVGDTLIKICPAGLAFWNGRTSAWTTCQSSGQWNIRACDSPVTCVSTARASATPVSGEYTSLDFGTGNLVAIFCDFRKGHGYTFISPYTLGHCSSLANHFTSRDHVMVRHLKPDGSQWETKLSVLTRYSDRYNVSVLLSETTGFQSFIHNTAELPYLFMAFVPLSYGDVNRTQQGYNCWDIEYPFTNCNGNAYNYFVLFDPGLNIADSTSSWLGGISVMKAWLQYARKVSVEMQETFYFNKYEMHMGGCGGIKTQYQQDAAGVAFGLLFNF